MQGCKRVRGREALASADSCLGDRYTTGSARLLTFTFAVFSQVKISVMKLFDNTPLSCSGLPRQLGIGRNVDEEILLGRCFI